VGGRVRLEPDAQFLSHEGTAQCADEKPGSAWIVFGVVSIGEAENIASELQDHVLKATARPQARNKIFAS
jgi:hypothetical protein